jgi:hypothetical protein
MLECPSGSSHTGSLALGGWQSRGVDREGEIFESCLLAKVAQDFLSVVKGNCVSD